MPDLLEATHRAIDQMNAAVTQMIQQVSIENATFSHTLRPLAHAENTLAKETHLLVFYADAHPDAKTQQASTQARALLDDFAAEVALIEFLFTLIIAVVHKAEDLSPEDARLLATKHRTSILHGMLLPNTSSRDHLRDVRGQISEATAVFHSNLANTDGGVWYSRSPLDGVPERILASLELSTTGLLKVTISQRPSRRCTTLR